MRFDVKLAWRRDRGAGGVFLVVLELRSEPSWNVMAPSWVSTKELDVYQDVVVRDCLRTHCQMIRRKQSQRPGAVVDGGTSRRRMGGGRR